MSDGYDNSSVEPHIYIVFGSAIFDRYGEEYEKLLKKNKQQQHLPIHEQTATDEKGRRRFHGAFTGGFSAGYFNTCGSEEGFVPKQFTSSKSSRVSNPTKKQSIYDFMDEDDMNTILGEEKLVTTGALSDGGNSTSVVFSNENNSLSIGGRLLKFMGWKGKGQGIGSIKIEKKKVFGPRIPQNDKIEIIEKEIIPRDIDVIKFHIKTDKCGIGFDPLRDAPEFERLKKVRNNKIGSSGFGVGAFEDKDMDVYGDNEKEVQYDISLDNGRNFQKNEKKDDDDVEMNDSRNVLEGFCARKEKVDEGWMYDKYPPPEIPVDFNENIGINNIQSSSARRNISFHNPETRRIALGEKEVGVDDDSVEGDGGVGEGGGKYFKKKSTLDLKKRYLELFSSRFVKANKGDNVIKDSGLKNMSKVHDAKVNEEKESRVKVNEDNNIVEVKIYKFHPAPMLSKRMYFPNPYPNSKFVGTVKNEQNSKYNIGFVSKKDNNVTKNKFNSEFAELIDTSSDEEEEAIQQQRPDMSYFQSIFNDGNDHDNDEIMKEKEENNKEKNEKRKVPNFAPSLMFVKERKEDNVNPFVNIARDKMIDDGEEEKEEINFVGNFLGKKIEKRESVVVKRKRNFGPILPSNFSVSKFQKDNEEAQQRKLEEILRKKRREKEKMEEREKDKKKKKKKKRKRKRKRKRKDHDGDDHQKKKRKTE